MGARPEGPNAWTRRSRSPRVVLASVCVGAWWCASCPSPRRGASGPKVDVTALPKAAVEMKTAEVDLKGQKAKEALSPEPAHDDFMIETPEQRAATLDCECVGNGVRGPSKVGATWPTQLAC